MMRVWATAQLTTFDQMAVEFGRPISKSRKAKQLEPSATVGARLANVKEGAWKQILFILIASLIGIFAPTFSPVPLRALQTYAQDTTQIQPPTQEEIEKLIHQLQNGIWQKKIDASEILGEMGSSASQAVVDTLTEVAEGDGDLKVRVTAIRALGKIGPSAHTATVALVKTRVDRNSYISNEAALALGRIGHPASTIPALTEALWDDDLSVRETTAAALGEIGPPAASAVPYLVAALRNEEWFVRVVEMNGTGGIEAGAPISVTTRRVTQELTAIWALQKIATPEALEVVFNYYLSQDEIPQAAGVPGVAGFAWWLLINPHSSPETRAKAKQVLETLKQYGVVETGWYNWISVAGLTGFYAVIGVLWILVLDPALSFILLLIGERSSKVGQFILRRLSSPWNPLLGSRILQRRKVAIKALGEKLQLTPESIHFLAGLIKPRAMLGTIESATEALRTANTPEASS